MNGPLADRLRANSTPFASSARQPLQLSDPATAWWVERGAVDVFAAARVDGASLGAREHLYRIVEGEMLLGFDSTAIPAGWSLLGVATPGTQLRTLSWTAFAALSTEPDLLDEHAALVSAWVSAVTRAAGRNAQPKQLLPLEQGQAQKIPIGKSFAPVEPLGYVRIEEGEAALLWSDDVRLDSRSSLLPLRGEAWMRATRSCMVRTLSPAKAVQESDFWTGLHTYHSLILRVALADLQGRHGAESARIRLKAAHSVEQMGVALTTFANTLSDEGPSGFARISRDPLLAACELIGRRIGVRFVAVPHSGAEDADRIEEIADAAHVRYRQVALRGEWWTNDSGPLLGRIQESKRPVALIRERGSYEVHDPVTQTVIPVDESVAATLVPFAQSFFRTLPARPLNITDLFRFAGMGVRGDLAVVFVLSVLVGCMGLLTPIVTGYVFDTLIPASDRGQTTLLIGALIAVAVATVTSSIARALVILRLETRVDGSLQAALWDRALNLPLEFFRRYSSGDLGLRLGAINTIRLALSGPALTSLLTAIFSLVSGALLFYYNVRLALVAIALAGGAGLLTVVVGAFKLRYDRQLSDITGRLSGLVLEYLRGVTKLRVTGAESRAFANWAREFGAMRTLSFRSNHLRNVNEVVLSLYKVVVDVAIFATVAWLLKEGATGAAVVTATASEAPPAAGQLLTTGQFIAFYAAFGQLIAGVTLISSMLLTVVDLIPVYERLRPILAAKPETDPNKRHPGELHGQVDMVNVSFHYADGPPVLDNVSFSVKPGGFVAFVGPSGSGKSTLMRCLLGYEVPTSGGVFYDNQNLAGLDVRAVRKQMGVVLQHSQLMAGDIYTNIVGTSHLPIDVAVDAAKRAGLEEDFLSMPMGLHTIVSEGGNTLSGGQRQRILIARAIVQHPRIMLLDEATSSLDNRTQEIVTRSLEQIRATRIVIAHRLTSVMNADRIFILDQGRIVQSGTYAELLAQKGIFRDLAARQLI